MKIKDIISEAAGFRSGLLKSLMPSALRKVVDTPKIRPEPREIDLAKAAYDQFGDAPDREGMKHVGWLTDKGLKSIANDYANVNADEIERLAQQTKAAAQAAIKEPKILTSPETTAENIPSGYRIAVKNPQGNATFYKYPGGRWTDESGVVMPSSSHAALDQFADTRGTMEKIPPAPKRGRGRV